MTRKDISEIYYLLGRIEGLAEGSEACAQEAIGDCVEGIKEILAEELLEGEIVMRRLEGQR